MSALIISCGNNNNTGTGTEAPATATLQESGAVNAATSFLKWYKAHYEAISKIRMVNDNYDAEETGENYAVNFTEAEHYLAELRSSGFVSEKYLAGQMAEFRKNDSMFKVNPQKGGPPDGFNADLVLMTQELDATLEAIDAPKVLEVKETGDNASVKLDIMMHLRFHMSKTNGKWMIDAIENTGLE